MKDGKTGKQKGEKRKDRKTETLKGVKLVSQIAGQPDSLTAG